MRSRRNLVLTVIIAASIIGGFFIYSLASKAQPPALFRGSFGPDASSRPTYQPSGGVSNSDDINLLAHLVEGEAAGEPYEGKVAVAAVILNRTNHDGFPHTIAGVVYQPDAFESITNGVANAAPSDESIRAAEDAVNGWDPSQGALFFWNPYKPVSAWIWSRVIITQIGDHVFAK